ncbi:MAG: transcription antitermination factor NusB [Metamycoplasmataceae bacterium]
METKNKSLRKQRIEMVQIIYEFELFNKIIDLDYIFENFDITDWQNKVFQTTSKFYERNKKIVEPILLEGRTWESIPPLNRGIIALASSELLSLDKKIVIDEYISICKDFSPDNSYKFLNNIIDKVAIFYEHIRNKKLQEKT